MVPTFRTPPLLFSQVAPSFLAGLNEDRCPREAAERGWEESTPHPEYRPPEHRAGCRLQARSAGTLSEALRLAMKGCHGFCVSGPGSPEPPCPRGMLEALPLPSCLRCRGGQSSALKLTQVATPLITKIK